MKRPSHIIVPDGEYIRHILIIDYHWKWQMRLYVNLDNRIVGIRMEI